MTLRDSTAVNFGLTDAQRQCADGFRYLDVVAVRLNPCKVLTERHRIWGQSDANQCSLQQRESEG